jgi:hypothetical protein
MGQFEDRGAFLGSLRTKLTHLRSNILPGMTEVWEQDNGLDLVRLAGLGINVRFKIGTQDWSCEASLPEWLPIPQRKIEEKFDEEFAELLKH